MEEVKELELKGRTNIIFKDLRKRITKGFVSLNNVDRDQEQVPPEAFNIEQFMENPMILYNHKFWKDSNGNEITVGVALDLFVAEVVDIGNSKYWGVRRSTGEIADTFPKNKVRGIMPGDRGLWGRTKYTVQEIWEKIKNAELTAHSWQGRARIAEFQFNKEKRRVLLDIDLLEYSPVSIPANPRALFVMEKNMKDSAKVLVPVRFLFSKLKFKDENDVRKWLANQEVDLSEIDIIDLGQQWQVNMKDIDDVDGKEYSIGFEDGVQAVSMMSTSKSASINGLLSKGFVMKEEIIKSVVPYKKFPLAPIDTSWSFTAADGNAILGENEDWDRYKSVHTWFDPQRADTKDGYKLPHHKEIDGQIKTVFRGVVAAYAVLNGSRGGVDIPESEMSGCYSHLEKHYKDFDKEPPERKAWSLSDFVEYHKSIGVELDVNEFKNYFEKEPEMEGEDKETKEVVDTEREENTKEADVSSKIDNLTAEVREAIKTLKESAVEVLPMFKQMIEFISAQKADDADDTEEKDVTEDNTDTDKNDDITEDKKDESIDVLSEIKSLRIMLEEKLNAVQSGVDESKKEVDDVKKRLEIVEKATPASSDHDSKPAKKEVEKSEDEEIDEMFSSLIPLPRNWPET